MTNPDDHDLLSQVAVALHLGDNAFQEEHGYSFLDQWLPIGGGREEVLEFVVAWCEVQGFDAKNIREYLGGEAD